MHRSWLFVPADSERKIAKIAQSDADAVILDLEDAVAPKRKLAGREMAVEYLGAADSAGPAVWVRVNPASSELFETDLAEIVAARASGIVLPKPDSVDDLNSLDQRLTDLENSQGISIGSIKVLPIISETAKALFNLSSNTPGYSIVPKRVIGLTWGAEDLAAELGAVTNRTDEGEFSFTFQLARSLCQISAAAAGVAAIESVHTDYRDESGLQRVARRARQDGFGGMLAIHPGQVAAINEAFTPAPEEVESARLIVAAFAAQPSAGVVGVDGKMFDRPHLVQAERILALADLASD